MEAVYARENTTYTSHGGPEHLSATIVRHLLAMIDLLPICAIAYYPCGLTLQLRWLKYLRARARTVYPWA